MTIKTSLSKRIIIFIVSLSGFMEAIDTTILNTAIPAMSKSLQVHPVDLKIALISYLVMLAIFIPISGWLADKFGLKRIFVTAITIFTLSSLWCGFASTIMQLVLARSVQGLGGALMLPLGRLLILRTFPRHDVVHVMNHVMMVVAVGLMLGPFAGGFITERFSWHWIFWINIPVGIFAFVLAYKFLEDFPPKRVRPFDLIGFALFGGGLATLTFSLSYLSESSTSHRIGLLILCIAILLLANYFLYSRTQPHPIVDTTLFRARTFQTSILGNIIARLGFGAVPFLLPLMLQISLGYSAELSGLLIAPIAVGVMVVKMISLPTLRRFGYKKTLVINTVLVSLTLWLFQTINATTSVYYIAMLTFIFGLLISLQYSGMNSLAYADLEADDLSAAASIVGTTQQLAQSFGVAAAALLLHYYSPSSAGAFILTPTVFHQTFFTMGWMTLVTTLIFFRLRPNDGHQMLKAPQNV